MRGLFFAAAAALALLPASIAANASTASTGLALQQDDAAIITVQYYDPWAFYSGPGPLELPARVIGGTLGLVAGALDGGFACGPGPCYGGTYDERVAACFANFQSFDPASGTYTTYEGYQVLCPFLR